MTDWTPPVDYPFPRATEQAGSATRNISLSGLRIRLEGLEDDADQFVTRRFRRYLEEAPAGTTDLRLRFVRDPGAPFFGSFENVASMPTYAMRHAVRGNALYYACGTLCVRFNLLTMDGVALTRERTGTLSLSDPVHLAVENLLRACLAWTVLLRGGFMLHAASVVRGGRCHLFFGSSGSGKSTLAAICGGEVISDDLTLILPGKEGFEAIGSPFRGTYTACEDLTGRYPVAALYRLKKDELVYLEKKPASIAFTDFLANLPFVVSEINRFPSAWDAARSAFEKLQTYYLHFRKDASFWEVIDRVATRASDPGK
jgi:hypothetical protein